MKICQGAGARFAILDQAAADPSEDRKHRLRVTTDDGPVFRSVAVGGTAGSERRLDRHPWRDERRAEQQPLEPDAGESWNAG